jgi:hypothetical protein
MHKTKELMLVHVLESSITYSDWYNFGIFLVRASEM